MEDFGLVFTIQFNDDIFLKLSAGCSTFSSGMIINGKDIKYSYDKSKYSYNHLSLGFEADQLLFEIGIVNYSGYAKYCDLFEIIFGYGF